MTISLLLTIGVVRVGDGKFAFGGKITLNSTPVPGPIWLKLVKLDPSQVSQLSRRFARYTDPSLVLDVKEGGIMFASHDESVRTDVLAELLLADVRDSVEEDNLLGDDIRAIPRRPQRTRLDRVAA
jgi:hypothetical protein